MAPAGEASTGSELQLCRQGEDSRRGIPEAIFISDVEAICQSRAVPDIVAALQELLSKYQYMQSSLLAQKSSLKTKLPDIVSALETVNHLVERRSKLQASETTEYTYQLSENIYSRATVPPTDVICLWLGANCMLEYTLDEAVELLTTNEANARTTLKNLNEDMSFLRDQITTTEVNIARTHNYGVKLRQKLKEEGKDLPQPQTPAALPAAMKPAAAAAPKGGKAYSTNGEYTWKQEGEELEVTVPVSPGAQKTDVKVTFLTDQLRVQHSGKTLLDGELAGKISPDGCTWTLNGDRVEITLQKAENKAWPSLLEDKS